MTKETAIKIFEEKKIVRNGLKQKKNGISQW
jgi:hypothetical protein